MTSVPGLGPGGAAGAQEPADPAALRVDVLVAGAGPVGLLAAAELVYRGCSVRIIDARLEPWKLTKAVGIHARSLEVLPQRVVDSILDHSVHVRQACFHEFRGQPRKLIGELDLSGIANYHGVRCQEQWKTEAALRDYLESLPNHRGGFVQVERGKELLDFREAQDGVHCEVACQGGHREQIQAKFLVGCDGGRSCVRRNLGFSFDGVNSEDAFFALHASLDNYEGDPHMMNLFFSRAEDPRSRGLAVFLPLPDGDSVSVVDVDAAQQEEWLTDRVEHGLPVLRQPSPEDIRKLLVARGFGENLAIRSGSVKWIWAYRIQSRQSSSYGKGRVFLAGDACHCHSPVGGQGMNMGFQNAKNLAWKLALVVKGVSPPTLLQTYEEERRDIDGKILFGIRRAQTVVSSRSALAFFLRGRLQRLAPMLINRVRRPQAYISQQAWSYSSHSLSVEHWETPNLRPTGLVTRIRHLLRRWVASRVRAGDAVPDVSSCRGGQESLHAVLRKARGFTLLLFEGQEAANAEARRLDQDLRIYNCEELEKLGSEMKLCADETGFVAGVDEILVLPASRVAAHRAFGAAVQCLFLVRPDHHVGLRCEPVRMAAVDAYLADRLGLGCAGRDAAAPLSAQASKSTWLATRLGAGGEHPWLKLSILLSASAVAALLSTWRALVRKVA